MKKKGIPAFLLTLLVLTGVAAYGIGGTSTDPLVSLDYLQNTYLPALMGQVEDQAEEMAAAAYEKAAAQVDSLAGGGGGGNSASQEESTLLAQTRSQGDVITMKAGSALTVAAGSLSATLSGGELIDVSEGWSGTSMTLSAGHRYVVGEKATAAIKVLTDAAEVILEGNYSVRSGGQKATPFTDLLNTEWYYSYVLYANQEGLLNGVSPDRFAPQAPVTRAMLATVLYRMAGEPSASSVPPFRDIPRDQWYSKPVTWAADSQVVSGVGQNRFAPDSSITREQMAVMLRNYASAWLVEKTEPTGDLSKFTDGASVSDWAREAMAWAVGQGIVSGKDDGRLDPAGHATRAEVCAMLQRFLSAYPS